MVMTDRTMPDPGPEMDKLVAMALGEDTIFPAYYSRDTYGIAMDALEKWREQHPGTSADIYMPASKANRYRVDIVPTRGKGQPARGEAPTLPQAICEAIIRAHWALEDAG